MANTRPRPTVAKNTQSARCGELVWRNIKSYSYSAIAPLRFIDGITLATLVHGYIAWNTDRTLHNTLVAANRAWLTPNHAQYFGNPKIGEAVFYAVQYGNAGREPATEFVAQEDLGVIDAPQDGASFYTVFDRTKLKDICKRTAADDGGDVIYPSAAADAYTYTFRTTKLKITPEIENGKQLIFVNGCFAYKSFHEDRKSEYCFIFVPPATQTLALDAALMEILHTERSTEPPCRPTETCSIS